MEKSTDVAKLKYFLFISHNLILKVLLESGRLGITVPNPCTIHVLTKFRIVLHYCVDVMPKFLQASFGGATI